MSISSATTLTAEQFWASPLNNKHSELIRGEVVEKMPPGGMHGNIAARLVARLVLWAEAGKHGWVGVESGFVLSRDPDVVRGLDVAFVRQSRIPASGVPAGFWTIAPDLAVEVISPSEAAADVRDGIAKYLAAGTQLVWEIYPQRREIVVHTPDGVAQTFRGNDVLEFPEVLPGFRCTVSDCFPSA